MSEELNIINTIVLIIDGNGNPVTALHNESEDKLILESYDSIGQRVIGPIRREVIGGLSDHVEGEVRCVEINSNLPTVTATIYKGNENPLESLLFAELETYETDPREEELMEKYHYGLRKIILSTDALKRWKEALTGIVPEGNVDVTEYFYNYEGRVTRLVHSKLDPLYKDKDNDNDNELSLVETNETNFYYDDEQRIRLEVRYQITSEGLTANSMICYSYESLGENKTLVIKASYLSLSRGKFREGFSPFYVEARIIDINSRTVIQEIMYSNEDEDADDYNFRLTPLIHPKEVRFKIDPQRPETGLPNEVVLPSYITPVGIQEMVVGVNLSEASTEANTIKIADVYRIEKLIEKLIPDSDESALEITGKILRGDIVINYLNITKIIDPIISSRDKLTIPKNICLASIFIAHSINCIADRVSTPSDEIDFLRKIFAGIVGIQFTELKQFSYVYKSNHRNLKEYEFFALKVLENIEKLFGEFEKNKSFFKDLI